MAFINFNKRWAGVKTWTVDYGRELVKLGHNVIMIIRKGTGHRDIYESAGFTVYEIRAGMKYNPSTIYKLSKILIKNDIDISVVNISKDLNIGATASKLSGIPVIHRVGLINDVKNRFEDRALHKTIIDAVIVPSYFLKAELADIKWFNTSKINVIPNSKIADNYPISERRSDGKIFGITSRLDASKGHDLLIEAFEKVKREIPDAQLYIAGTGKREGLIRERIRELGLEDSVKLYGFIKDVPAFLAELDVYVLTSLEESFGNTVLEAMFAALPIVSFETGGVPEVLGGTGILVPAGDTDALAEKMILAARDPELRMEKGTAARKRAEEVYDLKKNTCKLIKLIEEVISSR
ncbi:glycosyltransferase family 4 protein [Geovibrio thiophilus]|nr:glycosyltransferase family 4 protein [Geovibrio thiophilus]